MLSSFGLFYYYWFSFVSQNSILIPLFLFVTMLFFVHYRELCIFCSFLLIILLSYLKIIIIITKGFGASSLSLSLPFFFFIIVDGCCLWVLLKVSEKLEVLPCQTSFKFYNKPTYLLKHPI